MQPNRIDRSIKEFWGSKTGKGILAVPFIVIFLIGIVVCAGICVVASVLIPIAATLLNH